LRKKERKGRIKERKIGRKRQSEGRGAHVQRAVRRTGVLDADWSRT